MALRTFGVVVSSLLCVGLRTAHHITYTTLFSFLFFQCFSILLSEVVAGSEIYWGVMLGEDFSNRAITSQGAVV